jgi:hypothetical protein
MEGKRRADRRTDSALILLLTAPAGMGGTVFALSLAAGRLSVFDAGIFNDERHFAIFVVFFLVALLNLAMVVYFYRQKHTYAGFVMPGNPLLAPVAILWFFVIGPVFFYSVMFFVPALFVGVPGMGVFRLLEMIRIGALDAVPFMRWFFTVLLLLTAVPAVIAGISAVSRAGWIIHVRGGLRNLPTARTRSAAVGLLELQGRALNIGRKEPDEPILGRDPRRDKIGSYHSSPFYLEDDTGRLLVVPPEMNDSMSPYFFLRLHEVHAQPVLMHGDRVYVIGQLERDAGTGEAVVRPWQPPYGFFYRRLLGVIGRFGRYFEVFSVPLVFVVASGNETEAKARFLRSQYRWMGVSLLLGFGGSVVLTVIMGGLR